MLVIPLLPPLTGAAISQSTLDNVQTQAGAVSSTETLNVVTSSNTVTGVNAANGNAVSGAVVSGTLAVQSQQSLTGAPITATTTLNVANSVGGQTALTTAATGNNGVVGSYSGGGPLSGTVSQSIDAGSSIVATSNLNAGAAQVAPTSMSVQAVGNAQGVNVGDTSATLSINQVNNAGLTSANGGAVVNYSGDQGTYSAIAAANSVTASGTGVASQGLTVNQAATGQTVSEQDVNLGNGQSFIGSAAATANNLTVTNTSGGLSVTENQASTGYVQAQANVSGYEYGAGQASAIAVANSALLGNSGQTLNLDNTQNNSFNGQGANVVASATYAGNGSPGYDAYATASATGNSVTGYACSNCNGTVTVTNNQSNSSGVSANAEVDLAAANRSVNATAAAVGNNASFYVSKPSH